MNSSPVRTIAVLGVVFAIVSACSHAHGRDGGKRSDMRAELVASVAEADKDGSGGLDAAEFEAWLESRRAARVQQMMERLDANEDGQITAEEMRKISKRRWHHRGWH